MNSTITGPHRYLTTSAFAFRTMKSPYRSLTAYSKAIPAPKSVARSICVLMFMTLREREFPAACMPSPLNGDTRARRTPVMMTGTRSTMSNTKDKDSQQPLTPREQLRNLVEGLCEEPFQLDLARFDDQFQNLRVKLLSYAQDHLNLDSSTEFV